MSKNPFLTKKDTDFSYPQDDKYWLFLGQAKKEKAPSLSGGGW
jgi:hypothetical protein